MTGRITHGHTRGRTTTPEFRSWLGMRQRCYYPNHAKYPKYGARGITVCEQWKASFETFLIDMEPRPAGTTLDRIDNDGNYEPGNCRWATPKEQRANTSHKPFDPNDRPNCPSGHPYSGDNVRYPKEGGRKCKKCERIRSRQSRLASKGAV